MTDLTDDQVRALAHRYRFAKDDHERTIAQTARALLDARAELAATRDQIEALRGALEACVASLERADTEEGVCCCGDSMDRHSDPMTCGHSPVDMGDYYAGQALKSARAALASTPPETDGGTGHD